MALRPSRAMLTDTEGTAVPTDIATRPLLEHFAERVAADRRRTAVRWQARGIWRQESWGQYHDRVERLAGGLHELGVAEGSPVLIIGRPSATWLHLDLALQCLGALPAPAHAAMTVEQLRRAIEELTPTTVVVLRPADLARFRAAEPADSPVRRVLIGWDRAVGDGRAMPVAAVETLGPSDDQRWISSGRERSAEDPAVLAFTAGTSGDPRIVVLSWRNLLAAWSVLWALPSPPTAADRVLSTMCPGLLAERALAQILPIRCGSVVHFPESERALVAARRDIKPTICGTVPAVWEAEAKIVAEELAGAPRLRRAVFRMIEKSSARRYAGHRLLRHLGHDRTRIALVTGGRLAPEVERQWRTWGLHVREVYGSAENGGVTALYGGSGAQRRLVARPNGTDLTASPTGELHVSGANVARRYWDGATIGVAEPAELASGDVAAEGGLGCAGPLSRRFRLAEGTVVDPVPIEDELRGSRYVARAAVAGEGWRSLGAVLEPNLSTLVPWAARRGVVFSSTSELVADPLVIAQFEAVIATVNARLVERGAAPITAFRITAKRLVPGRDITASGSIRIGEDTERLAELIEQMRADLAPNQTTEPQR